MNNITTFTYKLGKKTKIKEILVSLKETDQKVLTGITINIDKEPLIQKKDSSGSMPIIKKEKENEYGKTEEYYETYFMSGRKIWKDYYIFFNIDYEITDMKDNNVFYYKNGYVPIQDLYLILNKKDLNAFSKALTAFKFFSKEAANYIYFELVKRLEIVNSFWNDELDGIKDISDLYNLKIDEILKILDLSLTDDEKRFLLNVKFYFDEKKFYEREPEPVEELEKEILNIKNKFLPLYEVLKEKVNFDPTNPKQKLKLIEAFLWLKELYKIAQIKKLTENANVKINITNPDNQKTLFKNLDIPVTKKFTFNNNINTTENFFKEILTDKLKNEKKVKIYKEKLLNANPVLIKQYKKDYKKAVEKINKKNPFTTEERNSINKMLKNNNIKLKINFSSYNSLPEI